MNSGEIYDFKKDVRKYISVFVALACLTVVTVGASYLEVGDTLGIILALIIAMVKASLVACYFMHLISEKKLIYAVLALTVIFFTVVMLLPTISFTGD